MRKTIIAAAAAAAFLPMLASAQFAKTEDAIKYRQSAMFILGQHLGRIGAMVNDKIAFDATEAKASAGVVNVVAKLPWPAFVPGSGKGDTKARPEVWEDSAKFKAAQERLVGTLPKLAAASDTGDKAKIKEAFGETAAACKNCHDSFRAK